MTECLCDLEQHRQNDSQKPNLITVEKAQAEMARLARCQVGIEEVPLELAQGRILASDVFATLSVPPYDNSAMDGYGLNIDDLPQNHQLQVTQRVPAGTSPSSLQSGTAIRIFTGAPVPTGVDTVVPQEQVRQLEGTRIEITATPTRGQNIRRAGEDVQAGARLLAAGTRLEAAELGVLASQGISDIPVYRRLRVAVVTTGNELITPGQPLKAGQIYNSNSVTIGAALQRLGCEVTRFPTLADSGQATRDALAKSASEHDLVITTGGVSVGDEDYVRPALESLGYLHLWGIAMKPGKPFAFGQIGTTPVVCLPGNPTAALVTFEVMAIPLLRRLMGTKPTKARATSLPAGFNRRKTTVRQEYLRVFLDQTSGVPTAIPAGSQSSGVLSVASKADGYFIIPPQTPVNEGEHYDFVYRDNFYQ
ncbi:gephyrin-like molybdotransferase Glp [Marinobacter sp. CHS3-4]|uniref:molybdopterin molybdotransferase MoeA n=1 Tax=Marinobacter sp. CHS3-4 TaxID=3045174 RepID=UPI0024B6340F|nr:gephyrin-like molybdotransferase Glp [Marinobacter sp. CHS3-4]MDI9244134.1 molybdopterin molybdotransferase MoeA [Marinobacter sp. CHS3-4]